MKRQIDKIELVFFQDDVTGDYGLTHKDTTDNHYGDSFNAFWDGFGIFHDIFEHSHEYKHKYFQGKYAMNVGGEMAAMGKMWYYMSSLGLWSERMINPNSFYSPSESMRKTTQDMIEESIKYGYCNFGDTLECGVPLQSPLEDSEMEYQIEKYWNDVKTYNFKDECEQERKASKGYKKSVTFRKIADLHRWGYREAERIVPDNYENLNTLRNFMNFWKEFCKNNNAKELTETFKGIDFYLYKEKEAIAWKAVMNSRYPQEIENIKLTEKSYTTIHIDEYYINQEEYDN